MAKRLTTPPARLKGAALSHWKQIAGDLARSGIIDWADRNTLATYCELYARYAEISRQINRDGLYSGDKGRQAVHPLFKESMQLCRQFMALGTKLGMTPLAREKLRVARLKMPRLRIAKKKKPQ